MAVRTAHLTLCNFLQNRTPGMPFANHGRNFVRFLGYVIELQNHGIRFTAIDTRMRGEIFAQPFI